MMAQVTLYTWYTHEMAQSQCGCSHTINKTRGVLFVGLQSALQSEQQSSELVVQQDSTGSGHTKDAQQCESSTGQMAMTNESVIQADLKAPDSECPSTTAVQTSLSRQSSEQEV